MECVGCANCVDACDEIMGRLGKPRGLVRYDSQRAFDGTGRRSLKRPRVFVYAVLGLVGLGVFLGAASRREAFEAKLLRARGLPYALDGDAIRNLYTVRIQNKEAAARTYFLTVAAEGPAPEFVVAQPRVRVEGLQEAQVPVFAALPRDRFTAHFPVRFTVTDSTSGHARTIEARFRGPE
jgi:polyferredoxin